MRIMRILLFFMIAPTVLLFDISKAQTAAPVVGEHPAWNGYVLAAIQTMPTGGGYDASQAAVDRLAASVKVEDGVIRQNLNIAKASFCSGATYMVFLRVIEMLRKNGNLKLSPEALRRFAEVGVKDGEMAFGRWNANGPGTAKLFAELKCGRNFSNYNDARAGDFMKIWWTEAIGGRERGHLVVYLDSNKYQVRFWSANQPEGYGIKAVDRKLIQRVLFSRLDRVDRLENISVLPAKNNFLADMFDKPFTWDRVVKECDVH